MTQDAFSVLGVSPAATRAEIKTAWRDLCCEYHPDRIPVHLKRLREDAEEKLKAINVAYVAVMSRLGQATPVETRAGQALRAATGGPVVVAVRDRATPRRVATGDAWRELDDEPRNVTHFEAWV